MAGDPLDQLGVPAQQAAPAAADPLASLGTPAVAAPPANDGIMAKIGQAGQSLDDATTGVAKGFAKGIGDTTSGISHLLNKIPGVGETLAPSEGITALDQMDKTNGTSEGIGKGAENIAEFAMGDEALSGVAKASRLVSLAKKYPLIADTLNLATQHPWLAKIITEGGKGAVTGGVEGGVKGAQQDNAVGGAERGAAVGGAAGAAVGTVSGAIDALKSLRVNPFRKAMDVIKEVSASPAEAGEAVSQPIAQSGVNAVAPPVGNSFRSGIDVQTPYGQAKALYKTVDDAAKTDFKGLYDKLDNAQDEARLAAPGSPEEAKAQLNIKNTQDAIDDAKKVAAQSGVPDVDKTLAQADAKYAETQANKDLNSKFATHIRGNVSHGAPETFNIDSTIQMLEQMDKPNKYGISRLQQTSLGPKGAAALKQVFYDAKKAGAVAMNSRALRNKFLTYGIPGATGLLGLAYEATK